jgi:hypothetical protein
LDLRDEFISIPHYLAPRLCDVGEASLGGKFGCESKGELVGIFSWFPLAGGYTLFLGSLVYRLSISMVEMAHFHCRSNCCVLCGLLEVRRSIKCCDCRVAKDWSSLVNSTLQWNRWYEAWEEKMFVEIWEWIQCNEETTIQLHMLKQLEREFRDYLQIQRRKYLELDLKLDSLV